MRITFVLPSLAGGGGAERAVVWLARGLQERGHEISVITLSGTAADFHKLPDGVARVALDIRSDSPTPLHGLWRNLWRMKTLRQAVKATRPAVVIPHINQTNVLTLCALAGTGWPVVPVEHSGTLLKSPGRVWRALRRVTYPQAARVVCVSQGAADYFDWLPASRKTVIYNPLVLPPEVGGPLPELNGADTNRRWVVAMGRMLHVKGFDLLLAAWRRIAGKYPDWQLVILGTGPLYDKLRRNDLGDAVTFAGFVANPFPVLRRAEIFVMSSRAEGLPYALLEAMACGCPAVSFDCPDGPREIIRHETDGLLVANGNPDALADALERLLSNETERHRMAAHAPEVLTRFGLEQSITDWERLLTKVGRTNFSLGWEDKL